MPVISEAKRRGFTGLTGQGAQPPNKWDKRSYASSLTEIMMALLANRPHI